MSKYEKSKDDETDIDIKSEHYDGEIKGFRAVSGIFDTIVKKEESIELNVDFKDVVDLKEPYHKFSY